MIPWLSHAFIAQLVEHLTRNEKVSSSILDVGSGACYRVDETIKRWNKIAPFPTSVGFILPRVDSTTMAVRFMSASDRRLKRSPKPPPEKGLRVRIPPDMRRSQTGYR